MKCPKCNTRMIHYEHGWASSRLQEGGGAPVPGHYSCWCCGKYVPSEEAPALPMDKKMIKPVSYSYPMDDPWVKELVHAKWDKIEELLTKGKSWTDIAWSITDRELSRQQLCNTYHRELRRRGKHKPRGSKAPREVTA